MAATKTNTQLAATLAQSGVNTIQTSQGFGTIAGTPDLGPITVEGDTTAVTSRVHPRAHAATYVSCGPSLWSVFRYYIDGRHVISLWKTLGGWCFDGNAVLFTWNWGHYLWRNDSTGFCVAAPRYQHGPDGAWVYSSGAWHTQWAHGATWGWLGGGIACYPFQGPYHAALRVAGNGYWDADYDYPGGDYPYT